MAMIYVDDQGQFAEQLKLRPVDSGANVLLAAGEYDVVFDRVIQDDGLNYTAPSQTAVDLLTGPGRSPAEGQALLDWMESMNQPGGADLLLAARSALLDALEALKEHINAVIVVGAQAIYLHTGAAPVALAEATKDCDLVLDTRELAPEPLLEDAMRAASPSRDPWRVPPSTGPDRRGGQRRGRSGKM